jgi:hypothetical protein
VADTLANANALFQGLQREASFHKRITISAGDVEDVLLRSARRKLRDAIRARFAKFSEIMKSETASRLLFEGRGVQFRNAMKNHPLTTVRFLTQGSFAYQLLVRPAKPEQEIDLDDGVYVPMPFIAGRPAVSSKGLFELIETAIADVVKTHGWAFEQKDTCVRVCIGHGAHIDLPVYAVESEEFERVKDFLEEEVATRNADWRGFDLVNASELGRRVEAANVLLAHRQKDWEPSDPKEFADWFVAQLDLYGPTLRRVVRYLKAWRDERWIDGDLKSMALMILCVSAFQEIGKRPADDRDDLIVLEVARLLPQKIREGSICWREDKGYLDDDWSLETRDEIVAAAVAFKHFLESALVNNGVPELVVKHLRSAFGTRFPNAPESVQIGAASKVSMVRAAAPVSVPQPKVGSSVSG